MARTPIDFFFDFSSPYSYIASEWIEALAARHGRTVRWNAVLLGVTFQAAELKSPVEPSDQARVLAARFRALGALRRRAVHDPRALSGADAERRARVLVARGERPAARRELGPPRAARLLHARHGRPLAQRRPRSARLEFGLDAGEAMAIAADATWKQSLQHGLRAGRSRKACSARPSSSSTASRSGATTGAPSSSAGSRAGRSERGPRAVAAHGAAALPAHAGARQPAGQPSPARGDARPLATRTTQRRGRASSRA